MNNKGEMDKEELTKLLLAIVFFILLLMGIIWILTKVTLI
jgi:hypothetical protein